MASQDRNGSPFITATYQHVMNRQLAYICDCLNARNYIEAFTGIRTIVLMLKPAHKDPLVNNHIKHITALVANAMNKRSVDLYQTRRMQDANVKQILRARILPLFDALMEQLHKGGYLEKQPLQPKYKAKGKLEMPK